MKRIVIIGAGFAGLTAAKALKHADADVVVIDRANHNLFQPLLYQVATTVLSPAQIASPIRGLLKNHRNTTVFLGEVSGINKDAEFVFLRPIQYRGGNPVHHVLFVGSFHISWQSLGCTAKTMTAQAIWFCRRAV